MDISEPLKRSHNRDAFSDTQIWEWSLVLESKSIPHRFYEKNSHWRMLVPVSFMSQALYQIEIYTQENKEDILFVQKPLYYGRFEATFWAFLCLILFYMVSHSHILRLDGDSVAWIALGSVDVWAVFHGQWWRLVTGLTLHANITHLLSNVVVGGIFVFMVCREMGSGFGWFCVLLSGIVGNVLNCYVQPLSHTSLGASTFIFGSVGMLAAVRSFQYGDPGTFRKIVPFAAGLGLLSFLGSGGDNTDLGAHVFGFISGLVIGFGFRLFPGVNEHTWRKLNRLFGGMTLGVVLVAWAVALICGQ